MAWTQKESFAFFGTKANNPRWSWSARSKDGQVVAVTLWRDKFGQGGAVYNHVEDDPGWHSSPGHRELIDNLKYALDHLDGIVRVIVATAKDVTAKPRSIDECYPQKNLVMRVTKVDGVSGDFTLERVAI